MSEDYKVQWSIKPDTGDLINIRGNTVDEVEALMTDLSAKAGVLAAMLESIRAEANVYAQFPETKTEAAPSQGGNLCAHGKPYQYKSGTKKNGEKWGAQFCTVKNDPRLPECQPIWDR